MIAAPPGKKTLIDTFLVWDISVLVPSIKNWFKVPWLKSLSHCTVSVFDNFHETGAIWTRTGPFLSGLCIYILEKNRSRSWDSNPQLIWHVINVLSALSTWPTCQTYYDDEFLSFWYCYTNFCSSSLKKARIWKNSEQRVNSSSYLCKLKGLLQIWGKNHYLRLKKPKKT